MSEMTHSCFGPKWVRIMFFVFVGVLLLGALTVAVLYIGKIGPWKAPPVYTSLGDSISAGYYLESNKDGSKDGTFPEGTFSQQFRDYIGAVEAYDYSLSGQDTKDLLDIIEHEDHPQYAAIKEAVTKSDVVTLALGSNDVLGPALEIICDYFGVSVSEEVPLAVADRELSDLVRDFGNLSEVFRDYDFTSCLEQYKINYTKIIDILTSWNEDVTIFAVGYYNPFQSLLTTKQFLLGLMSIDLADTAQILIDTMNDYLMNHIYRNKKFVLVTLNEKTDNQVIHETTDSMINCHVDFSSIENTDVDPHPSQTGHNYIFSRLVEEYEKIK